MWTQEIVESAFVELAAALRLPNVNLETDKDLDYEVHGQRRTVYGNMIPGWEGSDRAARVQIAERLNTDESIHLVLLHEFRHCWQWEHHPIKFRLNALAIDFAKKCLPYRAYKFLYKVCWIEQDANQWATENTTKFAKVVERRRYLDNGEAN